MHQQQTKKHVKRLGKLPKPQDQHHHLSHATVSKQQTHKRLTNSCINFQQYKSYIEIWYNKTISQFLSIIYVPHNSRPTPSLVHPYVYASNIKNWFHHSPIQALFWNNFPKSPRFIFSFKSISSHFPPCLTIFWFLCN